ncbi:MAG: iron ABC transporter permease [Clostridiaceae bacterium]|nr:iron ABC transporter permease [Clostridiaceae bacterium]
MKFSKLKEKNRSDTAEEDLSSAVFGGKKDKLKKIAYPIILLAAAVLTFVIFVASISTGLSKIPFGTVIKILWNEIHKIPQTWTNMQGLAVIGIRLPRTLAALLIGSGLSLAGASYQSLFKNPMVSPDILGVSSGAAVGAAIAILIKADIVYIEIGAFIGGICAVMLTALIPKLVRNKSIVVLVLSGIIVGGLTSSLMSIIRMLADPQTTLADITYWTMGSLARVKMNEITVIGPIIAACIVILLLLRYRLNVLSLGESEAKSLGVNIGRTRAVVIVCSTLLTACSVSIAGTIGWVGLVIPHISRMITGPDNKKMLPIAIFLGGVFMMIMDLLARTLSVTEIPISVLTGIIGAPFFFLILLKQRRNVS